MFFAKYKARLFNSAQKNDCFSYGCPFMFLNAFISSAL